MEPYKPEFVKGNIFHQDPFSPLIENAAKEYDVDLALTRELLGRLVAGYRHAYRFSDGGERLRLELSAKGYLNQGRFGSNKVLSYLRDYLRKKNKAYATDDFFNPHIDALVTIGQGLLPEEQWQRYLRTYIGERNNSKKFLYRPDGELVIPDAQNSGLTYRSYIDYIKKLGVSPDKRPIVSMIIAMI